MADLRRLEIIDETAKAYLLRQTIRHEEHEAWVPKSMIDYIKKHARRPDSFQECDIRIPDWMADEKGFSE